MRRTGLTLTACLAALLSASACATAPGTALAPDYTPQPYVQLTHPVWARDAAIYQINTRQFTPEGTFRAAQAELPRLKALGVDILWLMPIHPIGEVNRKGSLGSPYAVKDFRGVNPEFGTLEDLKAFIDAAHALDMKVILDWVANHSAWDNWLVEAHPEWYSRNWKGELQPTLGTDWSDIIEFDYSEPGLRQYMTEAMVYWVEEVGVDGFRADVAGFVPLDFWEELRRQLDAIKPVFMLAEWDTRDLHQHAFDATYAWDWKNAMQAIARGEANAGALTSYYYYNGQNAWPHDAYRMVYVSNHDQNAWDGSAPDIYGEAMPAAIALSVIGEGIPTMYNGQEAGNTDMLAFFEKDPIVWREHPVGQLYTDLFALKAANSALWNGAAGAIMQAVDTDDSENVMAFVREHGDGPSDDAVFAVFNLSAAPRTVTLAEGPHAGGYVDWRSSEPAVFSGGEQLSLPAWGYRIFTRSTPEQAGR